jgi:hypothetical protein
MPVSFPTIPPTVLAPSLPTLRPLAPQWMYTGVGILPTLLLMGGSVLLAVHSALRVLPQFALIEPVGRHCPEAVLRRALKEGGLQPEEAAALAAQLGVELPAERLTVRRRRSWRPPSAAGSERGGPAGGQESAARRVLRRLLSIKPQRAASVAGSDDGSDGGVSDSGSEPGSPLGGRGGSRRSLEDLKSASMADLLRFLSTSGAPPGAGAGAGAGGAGSTAVTPSAVAAAASTSALAATPKSARSSFVGCGASESGGIDSGEGGLRRNKSASSLAAMLQAGAGGGHGGGGHGHGAGEPSSNVELAGEMLRALLLKQARAGQPITPRALPE